MFRQIFGGTYNTSATKPKLHKHWFYVQDGAAKPTSNFDQNGTKTKKLIDELFWYFCQHNNQTLK